MSAPLRPVRFEPSPCPPRAGCEFFLEAEIEEGVEVGVRDEVDRSAGPAVAAVRAAARHELLAPEAHGAAAAVPGRDMDIDFVDKHDRNAPALTRTAYCGCSTGWTLMTRPRAPWSSNFTAPADLGKQRVVLAEADVQARAEAAAALAHEDRPAGHDVAVEPLDAEPLRIAVAPVARTALSFFMCHDDFFE